ncbi:ribosome maturation factor RimM [Butyrivibrio sp. MC2013]|uniref:ribosome maturation factor RimM n=1 Tax=Butyrivibrio sp. MC2013 TaxID=1280686 RepID=UPI0004219182|nr:ribosome maturation factor RimM [Butyrivibrio sp. MC2013]
MPYTEKFQVGVIASTHGLKGEVNVFPTTEDPQRFKKLKEITMESEREGSVVLHIERVAFTKKFVILKFKEYNDINEVERFRGNSLTVPRKDAIELLPGEHYVPDMYGLDIVDEDGNKLGTLVEVIQTGANDVYEMKRIDGGPNVMIPSIKECVLDVDLDSNTMKIHVMKGLMD